MSYHYESQLDPGRVNAGAPGTRAPWIVLGYLLGLIGMSPAPLLYYWMFAPVGALLVAAICLVVGTVRPHFQAMASGALMAAAFGAAAAVTFFLAVANQ